MLPISISVSISAYFDTQKKHAKKSMKKNKNAKTHKFSGVLV